MSFKIKVRINVFCGPSKGVPLTPHPATEDVNMCVMYDYGCNKVKLKFTRNTVIVCNLSKALVTMDP